MKLRKLSVIGATLLLGTTMANVASADRPSGDRGEQQRGHGAKLESAFTVLPAGPKVSSASTVDARVAVTNPSDEAVEATVTFTWFGQGPPHELGEHQILVPAGETSLVTERTSAADLLRRDRTTRGRLVAVTRGARSNERSSWDLEVIPSETRALPILSAAWIEPGAYIDGIYDQARPIRSRDVRDDMDSMHAVGIDTVVFTYSEYLLAGWGAFYDTSLPELAESSAEFDVLEAVLDAAERNGQHVYVGLGRGDDLYLTYLGFNDPARVAAGLDWAERLSTDIWKKYGDSEAFYGWYLTHEAADIAGANNFYDPITEYLRGFSPDKPVMVAPSGTPVASNAVISSSEADVFAYQDAVGAGYIGPTASCLPACEGPHTNFSSGYAYTFNPENRIADLGLLFETYSTWHTDSDKVIWSDLEVWEMAGPAYSGAYAASFDRVIQQIDAQAPHVDLISAYAYPGFMANPASSLEHGGKPAIDLFTDYQEYYRKWSRSTR